jgi:Flp pilus assembly protein TadD
MGLPIEPTIEAAPLLRARPRISTMRAIGGGAFIVGSIVMALALIPLFMADLSAQSATRMARAGYLDEAEERLREAIRRTPQDAELHKMLGQTYSRMAMVRSPNDAYLKKALAAYHESVRRNPYDAHTFTRMGWTYLFSGDYPSAESAFMRARELDPHAAYVRYGLGTAYLWQKKLEAARRELEWAQRVSPDPGVMAALREVERLMASP